jgi:hypothetical protein
MGKHRNCADIHDSICPSHYIDLCVNRVQHWDEFWGIQANTMKRGLSTPKNEDWANLSLAIFSGTELLAQEFRDALSMR